MGARSKSSGSWTSSLRSRPSSFSSTPSSQLTRGRCSPTPASRDLLGDASVHPRLQALRFQLGTGGRFRGSSQGRARSSLLPRAPASACGRPLQETTPTRLSSHPRRRSRRSSRHLRLSPTSRPMRSPHSRPQCAASRSPLAREALGTAYFRLGRWKDAEAEFRSLVERSPSDDFAHFALGRALAKQGRQWEAARQFKLAGSLSDGGTSSADPLSSE